MKKLGYQNSCEHKWIPMPLVEYRDMQDHHWHKVHKALCEKCAEVKIVSDIAIKDFI